MSKQDLARLVSKSAVSSINDWLKKYPADRKRAAIIPSLLLVQEETGHLSQEILDAVANYLEIPHIAAYEVATFYSMFRMEPGGKYVISLCTNVSCMLAGSQQIVDWFEKELGIGFGETSSDGLFTLKEVECMAACGGAPMLEVNKQYHENLNADKLTHLITELKESSSANA